MAVVETGAALRSRIVPPMIFAFGLCAAMSKTRFVQAVNASSGVLPPLKSFVPMRSVTALTSPAMSRNTCRLSRTPPRLFDVMILSPLMPQCHAQSSGTITCEAS